MSKYIKFSTKMIRKLIIFLLISTICITYFPYMLFYKSSDIISVKNPYKTQQETQILVHDEEVQELMKKLPKASLMNNQRQLVNYQGAWYPSNPKFIKSILMFKRHFQPRNTDLIIASHPKTGTTWLKSLLFAIVNRDKYPIDQNPLLKNHPHELVYRLENDIYGDAFVYPRPDDLKEIPEPRLLHTHLPYMSLPKSITSSKCRVLYISRNPFDTFVSLWHFQNRAKKNVNQHFQIPSIEDYFEEFYQGKTPNGPFFDHVVGYWKQSLENSNKYLFLKYEDLKDDPTSQLKKLAEFIGVPFTTQEESKGVINEIIDLCSINHLKELEVNKNGVLGTNYEKSSFFRKGKVGDWTHYFIPLMVEKMNKIMDEKFGINGLNFKLTS